MLAPRAVDWQRRQLVQLIGPDLGLGSKDLRRELTKLLSTGSLADPSPGHRRLWHLIDHSRHGYLDRWANALRDGAVVKPERLARTLAAHLSDLGYSASFLATHWVAELRRAHANTQEIVESAARLANQCPRPFEVLLALAVIPRRPVAEKTAGWLSKAEVSQWLKTNGHSARGVRTGGGFLYRTVT